MSEAVYTKQDLSTMLVWPLEQKILVTQAKITGGNHTWIF